MTSRDVTDAQWDRLQWQLPAQKPRTACMPNVQMFLPTRCASMSSSLDRLRAHLKLRERPVHLLVCVSPWVPRWTRPTSMPSLASSPRRDPAARRRTCYLTVLGGLFGVARVGRTRGQPDCREFGCRPCEFCDETSGACVVACSSSEFCDAGQGQGGLAGRPTNLTKSDANGPIETRAKTVQEASPA